MLFLKSGFLNIQKKENITVEIHIIYVLVIYILFNINRITYNNKNCMEFET
jgi:hypothetical protein